MFLRVFGVKVVCVVVPNALPFSLFFVMLAVLSVDLIKGYLIFFDFLSLCSPILSQLYFLQMLLLCSIVVQETLHVFSLLSPFLFLYKLVLMVYNCLKCTWLPLLFEIVSTFHWHDCKIECR